MPRKRQLTDAEKDDIWRFHKEHPLVTHTDVASKQSFMCAQALFLVQKNQEEN